ncbi:MAG TPA: hypothetical protein VFS67_13980 [Polyangiaceae bacterium]|jgi:hypothetical protein|nr:hypothetical protein [Polyangiaceae bacterium]
MVHHGRSLAPRRRALGVAGALLLAALGCVRSARLDREVARVGQILLDAEADGALRCAPRELAVARSQLEFAELERAQGFPSKAEEHLAIAGQHARAARLLSPPERCHEAKDRGPGSSR